MNPFVQARRDIRAIAGVTRGLLALDEELGKAADLSKTIGEMEKRLDGLNAEEKKALSRKAAREKALDEAMAEARKQADAHIEAAMNEAHSIRLGANKANANANKAVESAYAEAAGIIERAKAEAKAMTDAAEKAVEQSRALANEAETTRAGLDQEIAARRRVLAEVNAEIGAMRKKLGA